MTGADGPGKPNVNRILLGGGGRILVLDGKIGQPLKIIPIQDVANHVFAGPGGTIYWIGLPNAPNRSPVYAASFPDFSGHLVRPSSVGIYPRASLFQADRIVQFEPWRGIISVAPSIDQEFRPLPGRLTGYGDGGRYGPQIATLGESHHYGILVMADKIYQVEFLKAKPSRPAWRSEGSFYSASGFK